MTFASWSRDRNKQGTPAHMARAIYDSGISYAEALNQFRTFLILEALADFEGDRKQAGDALRVSEITVFRHLRSAGATLEQVRGLSRELVVRDRKERAK